MSNWQQQMLYPYHNKFLMLDEIKDSLTGIGRIIEYRCCNRNVDPSQDFDKQNWIMSIKEGEFIRGTAQGFNRQMAGFNGHCKLGFFHDDQPYGNYVEYDQNGKEFAKSGIYLREGECIQFR